MAGTFTLSTSCSCLFFTVSITPAKGSPCGRTDVLEASRGFGSCSELPQESFPKFTGEYFVFFVLEAVARDVKFLSLPLVTCGILPMYLRALFWWPGTHNSSADA